MAYCHENPHLKYLPKFSYLWDRVCSIFSGAGKFCCAHGLRQLTRDIKVTSVVYKRYLPTITKNSEGCLELTFIFLIIGKKNDQSLVSDAD